MENQKEISTANRCSKILTLLEENRQVDVQQLSNRFKVSSVTIRNDLANLENKNLLYRTRGGAIKQTKVAEKILRDFYCDKLFLGVDGVDTSYGISTPSVSEA